MYDGIAPHKVIRPVMVQSWEQLTFLHWSYPVADAQKLLPPGLTVEQFDDKAWVSLVPFHLVTRLPGLPPTPWASRFPETNVRTYVTDVTGRRGIWFFSLDADRLGAVVVARTTYRLPYFWASMTVEAHEDTVRYHSKRRWPGPRGASCDATIRIGEPFGPEEASQLDHYLTARWTLFSAHARGLHYANAFHNPWPLHRAEVVELDESVVRASGLSDPTGTPIVHYSHNVDVNIGAPHRVHP